MWKYDAINCLRFFSISTRECLSVASSVEIQWLHINKPTDSIFRNVMFCHIPNNNDTWLIALLHRSHNAPVLHPTMHHFVKEMFARDICSHFCSRMVNCGLFVWCNERFEYQNYLFHSCFRVLSGISLDLGEYHAWCCWPFSWRHHPRHHSLYKMWNGLYGTF